jgi:hypothetical protein
MTLKSPIGVGVGVVRSLLPALVLVEFAVLVFVSVFVSVELAVLVLLLVSVVVGLPDRWPTTPRQVPTG